MPLCIAGFADSGVAAGPLRTTSVALLYGLGLALVLQFALKFNVRSFLTWEYDADTREIVDRLGAGRRPAAARVG